MANVKGLRIDIGANVKDFNKGMRNMNKEMKQTRRNVGLLSSALQIEWDSDQFERAQQEAQQALEQTQEKSEILQARMNELEESGQTDTAHYEELQSELSRTEAEATFAKQRLEELEQIKVDALAGQFEDVGESITNAGQALSAFSAAAAKTLGAFSAMGYEATKTGQELETLSLMYNMSTDAMQEWNYVASQLDIGHSEMQNAIRRTSQELSDLSMGRESEALEQLGISAEQAGQGMDENFGLIIERMSEVQDETQQTWLANEIFGRRMGTRMIPILQSGTETIEELKDEFSEFGMLTEEQIAQFSEMDDTFDRIMVQFKLIRNQIGYALLPIMTEMADFVENRIIPVLRRFSEWFNELDESVIRHQAVQLALRASIAPLLLIIGKLVGLLGTATRGFFGLSKAMTFVSAHPIVTTLTILTIIIATLMRNNEEFRQSMLDLFDTISNALAPIFRLLSDLLNTLFTSLEPIIDLLGEILVPIMNTLVTLLSSLFKVLDPIIALLSAVLTPLLGLMEKHFKLIEWFLGTFLLPAIEKLADGLIEVFEIVGKLFEWVSTIIDTLADKIIGFVNATIDGINAIGSVIGVEIDKIDKAAMDASVTQDVSVSRDDTTEEEGERLEDAIRDTPSTDAPQTEINQDNRQQDFTVEIDVYTMGEEIDEEDLARRINRQLAKQM